MRFDARSRGFAAALILAPALASCSAPAKCMRRGAQATMGADLARANAPDTSRAPPTTAPTTPSGPRVFARLDGAAPSRIAVSRGGRVFVAFPRQGGRAEFTVGELKNGAARPYPDPAFAGATGDAAKRLVCATALAVDAKERLWILDAGATDFGEVGPGAAKLVCVDLATDQVVRSIPFAAEVVPPDARLADVAVDLTSGDGFAFVADCGGRGPAALVVVDLKTGTGRRRLDGDASTRAAADFAPVVDGERLTTSASGVDSLAVDESGRRLFFCPLSGRGLSAVPLAAIEDERASDADVARAVVDLGGRAFASSALACDDEGRLLLADYENGAVRRRAGDGSYEILARSPELRRPSGLAPAADGSLYVACGGLDLGGRKPPYFVLRVAAASASSATR